MHQIYVKTGRENGDQNYLTMLNLSAVCKEGTDKAFLKTSAVDGYELLFSISALGKIMPGEVQSDRLMMLDCR